MVGNVELISQILMYQKNVIESNIVHGWIIKREKKLKNAIENGENINKLKESVILLIIKKPETQR